MVCLHFLERRMVYIKHAFYDSVNDSQLRINHCKRSEVVTFPQKLIFLLRRTNQLKSRDNTWNLITELWSNMQVWTVIPDSISKQIIIRAFIEFCTTSKTISKVFNDKMLFYVHPRFFLSICQAYGYLEKWRGISKSVRTLVRHIK